MRDIRITLEILHHDHLQKLISASDDLDSCCISLTRWRSNLRTPMFLSWDWAHCRTLCLLTYLLVYLNPDLKVPNASNSWPVWIDPPPESCTRWAWAWAFHCLYCGRIFWFRFYWAGKVGEGGSDCMRSLRSQRSRSKRSEVLAGLPERRFI